MYVGHVIIAEPNLRLTDAVWNYPSLQNVSTEIYDTSLYRWVTPACQLHSHLSSPLQLLGYYIKFSTDGAKPPLCAVISERGVQLMCFPYCTTSESVSERRTFAPSKLCKDPVPAVDALVLPELPLLDESIGYPNQHLLGLILVLCANQHINLYGSRDMEVIFATRCHQ